MILTVSDIEARTGQVYEDEQLDRVNAFISDITALIEAFLGRSFENTPAPPAVKAVAALEVMRLLNSDPGIASDRVGDLSTSYAYAGAVVALSEESKAALRPFRANAGIGSLQVLSRFMPEGADE